MKKIGVDYLNQFDILFWTASWKQAKLGWLIRKVTGDKVNHVGWYIGRKLMFRLAYESTADGPSVNEFSQKYPPKYAGRFKVPLTDTERISLLFELYQRRHRKYDWKHLFGYYLGLDAPERDMCPELINECLRAFGKSLRRDNEKPSGIFNSPDLEIYEIVY